MKLLILTLLICISFTLVIGQSVGINSTGASPDPGSILDISSTNKGLLIPRMTYSQRLGVSPSIGMLVYQTNSGSTLTSLAGFYIYDGAIWKRMARADEIPGGGSTPGWTISVDNQYSSVTGNVGIGTSTPSSKFHLYGNMNIDAASNPNLQFKNAGVDKGFVQLSDNNLRVGTNSSNTGGKFLVSVNNADRMVVDSLGQVGIGISAPDEYLHVKNKIRISPIGSTAQSYLQLYANPNNAFNNFGPAGISFHNWSSNGNGGYDYTSKYKIEFEGGSAERLNLFHSDFPDQIVLNKDGEVGIGKVPTVKLDVAGNTRLYATNPVLKLQTNSNTSFVSGTIEFNSPTNQNRAKIGYSVGALKLSGRENTGLILDDLVLDNNNVGINNGSPLTKLHIIGGQDAGSNSSLNGYIMNGNSTGTNLIIDNNEIMVRNGTTPSTMYLQNDGGTLNIGATTNFYQKVNINSSGEALKLNGTNPNIGFYQNGTYKSFISQSGDELFIGNNAADIKLEAVDDLIFNANDDVRLNTGGQVIIGTKHFLAPSYKLTVDGKIVCEEIKVALFADWPDYVFNQDYDLPPLSNVEEFIQKNNHLPNIPSAKEVANSGFELGEMNRKLLEKIEELTLYLIEQNKKIEALETKIK